MPTAVLKDLFLQLAQEGESEFVKKGTEDAELMAYPAAVTLILRDEDAPFFADSLAAGTVLAKVLRMSRTQEDWATPSKIAQGTPLSPSEVKATCLELVKRKYLLKSANGFRTPERIQYIYMPETQVFERARRARIRANVDRLLEQITPEMLLDQSAVRATVFKRITEEKAQQFRERMQALLNEITTTPDPDPTQSRFHTFIAIAMPEAKSG